MHPDISVVVPMKNEAPNVDELYRELTSALEACGRPYEIVAVDDGSTDETFARLARLQASDYRLRVIQFRRNFGQTAAFAAGFAHARGRYIVTMDGDLQNDPEDIGTLLPYAREYDLVCGWRTERHDTIMRKISSRVANAVRNAVTRDRVHDTGCSLKVFRRCVIERLQLFIGMHRFFPALALMHGFTVTEVPVRHHPRTHGISKYGVGNRLFKGLYDLMAVRWMQTRVLRYRFREK